MAFTIAVDFDGTCVDHRYPDVGDEVPGAAEWLRRFWAEGADLILWTMRSPCQDGTDPLADAVEWFRVRSISLLGINGNPSQSSWTSSPKVYANLYIDDAAFGCPLRENPRMGGRSFVDWSVVGPAVLDRIWREKKRDDFSLQSRLADDDLAGPLFDVGGYDHLCLPSETPDDPSSPNGAS